MVVRPEHLRGFPNLTRHIQDPKVAVTVSSNTYNEHPEVRIEQPEQVVRITHDVPRLSQREQIQSKTISTRCLRTGWLSDATVLICVRPSVNPAAR
jgi:hypothetical protein